MRLTVFISMILLLLLSPNIKAQSEAVVSLREQLHPVDYELIEANIDALSDAELQEIYSFMTDSEIIADSMWFDVSAYNNWEEYNFQRPMNEQLMTILGRRDLFLDPARQLNNASITNMSDEALAALTFSQVYVEETWDQEPPWDGDPNPQFNWIHLDLLQQPLLHRFLSDDFIYSERVGYWFATYWSGGLALLYDSGIGKGTDEQLILSQLSYQSPRLAGYAYPIGNQLYTGTAETVYWFTDYLNIGNERYGALEIQDWDTDIEFQYPTSGIVASELDAILMNMLNAEFATELRLELGHPETASFWNTMRYLHSAARQREGGGSETHPGNGQPGLLALRYDERTDEPGGRPVSDISAFSILTTVYSDSILLDFTNWNASQNTVVTLPVDAARSDGLHRMFSERNKAILVIEHMGDENIYPNATHITGSRGLGFQLTTQYDNPETGDFLPYTPDEAYSLVMALVMEVDDYHIEASQITLCNSPLLKRGYEIYSEANSELAWAELTENLCIA